MSQKVSIKVNIADRIFPLTVGLEEEVYVREAAKKLNDKINNYKKDFAVEDKQVLLSMCALEFATEVAKFQSKTWIEDDGVSKKINEISDLLNGDQGY